MFLKGLKDGSGNFGSQTSTKVVRNTVKELTIQKLLESHDIEHYLTTFEHVTKAFKWPSEIWSLKLALFMTGKAQVAFTSMDKDEMHCLRSTHPKSWLISWLWNS